MEKSQLNVKPHTVLPGQNMCEVWWKGELVAVVAGRDGPGIRIITKHQLHTMPGVNFPDLNSLEVCVVERADPGLGPGVVAQPGPSKAAEGAPIWDLVIADMRARDQHGRGLYGWPVQAHNGRDALVDAYQEVLDLAVYLRQAIKERKDGTTG